MDFRSCPACQASVLEDDAAECPFCGASMTSGKPVGQAQPAGKKSAPAPAASKPASAKPAATGKPTAKAPPTGKKKSDDGDPFDVDTSAARKAAPVRPKPAKGYMIRVTCPMCERAGFISEAEVGKEVKCCNPDCLVPVYVANAPRKEEPEPAPAAEGGNKLFLLGGLGVVAIGIAIAATFLMKKKPEASGPVTIPRPTAQNGDGDPGSAGPGQTPEAAPAQGPKELTKAEVVTRAMAELKSTMEFSQNARDRALSTRLLAESQVLRGESKEAQQLASSLTGAMQYAAIAPQVTQAWRLLAAGDAAGAKQAADSAWGLKDSLPSRGREALDLSADLAAIMVATGRVDEARTLAAAQNDPAEGEMTALWRVAIHGADYRFDYATGRTCLLELTHPQWAAIAQILSAQGQVEPARAWALAAPTEVTRDACSSVIAAHAAFQHGQGSELSAVVDPLLSGLSDAGRARVWSAVGQALYQRGDAVASQEVAKQASAALAAVSIHPAIAIPDLKAMYDLAEAPNRGLPDPLPMISAALAACDLYALQRAGGDQAAADQSLSLAIQHLRGTAPSAAGMAVLIQELDQDSKALRERMKGILMLDDSLVVSRFSRYQTQVRAWQARALERRDLEVRLLTRAALAGDLKSAWAQVQTAESSTDPLTRQSYMDSPLPGFLREVAQARKAADLTAQVSTAAGDRTLTVNPTDRIRLTVHSAASGANWKPLILDLTPYYERPPVDRGEADAAVLSLISRTFEVDPLSALSLAGQLPDTLLREDALWLIGARSVWTDKPRMVMEKFDARSFPGGTAAMFFRGCVDAATRGKPAPKP